MIAFSHYAKTINNFAITYEGMSPEYVVQLDYVIKNLKFKDFKVYLFVPDGYVHLSDLAIPLSKFPEKQHEFAFRKEIRVEPIGTHPILNFILECEINFPKLSIKTSNGPVLICPNATFPARKLVDCKFDGTIIDNPTIEMIEGASWVIGAENEWVFLAASKGIRTTLVPTGSGTDLYRLMFPHGEIH